MACSRSRSCGNCGHHLSVWRCSRTTTVNCPACHATNRIQGALPRITYRALSWMADNLGSPVTGPGFPASYPRVRRNKRALLCGVNYVGKRYELKGSENDVNYMKFMLKTHFQFSDDCILVLTETEPDPLRKPTKENMLSAMRWLVHECKHGDSMVFHFSGHGSQQVDDARTHPGSDERDGFDETLCPLDYETEGMILDDQINEILVRPIRTGATLHAIIDSCHSGTVLDLPYLCRINRVGLYEWEENTTSSTKKDTKGGLAICISGCADYQTSADTNAFAGFETTGAMTYSLIAAVENAPAITYGHLLYSMRSAIRGANISTENSKFASQVGSFLRKVLKNGLRQDPQLSSSKKFDIYQKKFLL